MLRQGHQGQGQINAQFCTIYTTNQTYALMCKTQSYLTISVEKIG